MVKHPACVAAWRRYVAPLCGAAACTSAVALVIFTDMPSLLLVALGAQDSFHPLGRDHSPLDMTICANAVRHLTRSYPVSLAPAIARSRRPLLRALSCTHLCSSMAGISAAYSSQCVLASPPPSLPLLTPTSTETLGCLISMSRDASFPCQPFSMATSLALDIDLIHVHETSLITLVVQLTPYFSSFD